MKLPWATEGRLTRSDRALTIAFEPDERALRIALEGELDLSNRAALDEEIRRAISAAPSVLVIDLRGLRFIDSTGIACLLRAVEQSRATGTELEIIRGPEPVQRVFEIAGLAELWPFTDGRAAA